MWLERAEFEAEVADALDAMPADLMAMLDNVVFLVEDDPPQGQPGLLGLYVGTPLTERGGGWAAGAMPDRITFYRHPLLAVSRDSAQLREQVRVTVAHEIGHHFGLDDERLHDLGWG